MYNSIFYDYPDQDDHMFDVGFDPHADQGPVDQDGAGIFRRLMQHIDNHSGMYKAAAAGALAVGVGSFFNPDITPQVEGRSWPSWFVHSGTPRRSPHIPQLRPPFI